MLGGNSFHQTGGGGWTSLVPKISLLKEVILTMDKTIRRVTDPEEQQAETYRYWQSRPVGERLIAVCELSEAAYAFAANFRGVSADVDQRSQRPVARIQSTRS